MPINRDSFIVLAFITACGEAISEPPPDPDPVPINPAGRFSVHSSFTLAAPPAAVTGVLAELEAATDGPDDPSRYLIELIIDRLPEGHLKAFAAELSPFIAAYVNDRIATVAPGFVGGVRALVDGLGRSARRFGTIEDVWIAADGRTSRTIEGLRFDTVDVVFAPLGLDDVTVDTSVVLDGDRLAIADHVAGVAYGQLLRIALDRAVIPSVVPGAADLARAFRELVDCSRLGELVADRVGLGSPVLYEQACTIGLTSAAARIYDGFPVLDAMPIALEVSGAARAADQDGDGTMDAIGAGIWTGTFDHTPLGVARFEGTAR